MKQIPVQVTSLLLLVMVGPAAPVKRQRDHPDHRPIPLYYRPLHGRGSALAFCPVRGYTV
jgi:hypothetical protein